MGPSSWSMLPNNRDIGRRKSPFPCTRFCKRSRVTVSMPRRLYLLCLSAQRSIPILLQEYHLLDSVGSVRVRAPDSFRSRLANQPHVLRVGQPPLPMAMRGRGRAVAIRSCLVVACIVCSAAAANSLALDELIKESGKHLENDYSEAKSSEKDQAEDGVQNEEASSQSREDQTPLGEEEYPADANTTISWSLPVYMHPTWLSKYSMCLKPGKTPSYCRFDSKTSQRIYALLTRSWAPQTNQRLSEGSGRWTHSVVNHVTARLGRIEKRCESALIPRKVPAAFMIRSSGRRKKAIVMTSLSGGPLCMPRSHDWRANLPRFLGGFLDATVIIYGQTSNTCFYCHHPQSKTEGCVDDIKRGVDAVIVVGVGGTFESSQACGDGEPADCQQQYFDMWQLLSHRWIESAKLLVSAACPKRSPRASQWGVATQRQLTDRHSPLQIHIPSANAPYPPRELFNVDVLMGPDPPYDPLVSRNFKPTNPPIS